MYKKQLFLTLIFCCFLVFSKAQTLSDEEIKSFEKFGLHLSAIDFQNETTNSDFQAIIFNDERRKRTKAYGFVFSSLGVVSTAFGIGMIESGRNQQEGLVQSIGGLFVGVGAANFGIAIPLFITSHKSKKRRDRLLELYN